MGFLPPQEAPSPSTDLWSLQVFFGRDQHRAQLVIDGLRAQDAAVATTGLFMAQSPFYVGGVPAGKAKVHVPVRAQRSHGIVPSLAVLGPIVWPRACCIWPRCTHSHGLSLQDTSASSFDGCLRNPQLDGKPLGAPSYSFGVTPCYEGALESGVFFAAEGGSISLGTPQQPGLVPMALGGMCLQEVPCPLLTSSISFLADAVATGQDLEVSLEVRPRSASGLIFHIGTRRSHHLLLYMEEMKVTGRAASPGFSEASPAYHAQFSEL